MIEIVTGSMGGARLNIEGKTVVLKDKLTIDGNGIFCGKQRVWLGGEKDKETDVLQKLYDENGVYELEERIKVPGKPGKGHEVKVVKKEKKIHGRTWRIVYTKDLKKFFEKNKLDIPESAKEKKDKE
jgi:hypothetical protein